MPRKPTGQPPGRRPQRGEKATHSVRIRVTTAELEGLRAAAKAAGHLTVSDYVRSMAGLSHT